MTQERTLSTADLAGAKDSRDREEIPDSMRESAPLFPGEEASTLKSRWHEIQTNFVDEPQTAVEQADGLVAETMKQLAETFSAERQNLEAQWSRGEEASTEDLRLALQRYRSFFNRLLSV